MRGKYDVYVLEVGGGFKVRPAVAMVDGGAGKTLIIRNLTNYDIDLDFDPGLLAGGQPLVVPKRYVKGVDDPKDKNKDKRTLALHEDADGDYDYRVRVLTPAGPVYAIGESGPTIIVDS